MNAEARREKLLVQEVGEEIIVYDQERHRAHRLNRSAAMIWRHCNGRTGISELVELLKNDLDLPADEEVVWLALDRLDKAHLLNVPFILPEAVRNVSRRQLIRRMAMAGGLTLMLPVVTSMTAPTPAMAQSGVSVICLCNAAAPPEPPAACLSTTVGKTDTTMSAVAGRCVPTVGPAPNCTGSCVRTASWVCTNKGNGVFDWVQNGLTDNCP